MSKAVNSSKKPKAVSVKKPRQRKLNRAQQNAKDKKTAKASKPITGSFRLSWQATKIIADHWKILSGIAFVYILLNIFLANGLNSLSNSFKGNNDSILNDSVSSAASDFGNLLSGNSGSSNTSSLTELVLLK